MAEGPTGPPRGRSAGAGAVQTSLPERRAEVAAAHPEAERVERWVQAEARVGQQGRVTRVWYERGLRPRGGHDQRFGSASLVGAVCPARDTGCALVRPEVATRARALLRAELGRALPAKTHAVVVRDRAGWHTADDLAVPPNLTPVPLPPYAPELNPVETVGPDLRERHLSHRLVADTAAVVDAGGAAWNRRLAEAGRVRSLGAFPWLPPSVTTS